MTSVIKLWDIPGGIHPPENKQQSVTTPIQIAPVPAELVLPLSQHIGAPAEPVVTVGDKVLKGQIIARAVGDISVHVHASSSGEVIAIEDRIVPHASGMSAPCIIIKTDGKDEWIDHQGTPDYTHLDKDTLIAIIRNAGVAGLGGAGFPAAVKLDSRPGKVIETLILNGAECEPYITADDMLMRERAAEVIQGTLILQYILAPSLQTLIGVEDKKPEAIAALKQAAAGTNIHIVAIPTKYPSGGKKQIIQILTGKEVPPGKSSTDIGVFCQNVGTAAAISRAVIQGEPLISRITTITGNAVKKPKNYEVLLGTPVSALLNASDYTPDKSAHLIMGGSMMGINLSAPESPAIKTTNCIIAATADELPDPPPAQACIRCGLCAEACPASLLPQQMFWFAQAKNHDALKKHHLFDCIECGACSYVCPSSIPLVQYYRASKADIRKADADHKKAEHSKERFEARLARLDRLEAEKDAKRKDRQSQASESAPATTEAPLEATDDPVQAALARARAKAASRAAGQNSAVTENNPASANPPSSLPEDPVQAAMARAKIKAVAHHNAEQKTRLLKEVASLQQRIASTEEKLASAEAKRTETETESTDAENIETVAALKTTLLTLQEKLASAQHKLHPPG